MKLRLSALAVAAALAALAAAGGAAASGGNSLRGSGTGRCATISSPSIALQPEWGPTAWTPAFTVRNCSSSQTELINVNMTFTDQATGAVAFACGCGITFTLAPGQTEIVGPNSPDGMSFTMAFATPGSTYAMKLDAIDWQRLETLATSTTLVTPLP